MKTVLTSVFIIFFLFGCSSNKVIEVPKKQEQKVAKKIEEKKKNSTITYEFLPKVDLNVDSSVDVFKMDGDFKAAIIYPSKVVGKYGSSTVNSVLGYLFYKNSNFEIETFDSTNEDFGNVYNAFNEAINKGYKRIIALYTPKGYEAINTITSLNNVEVYFPLLEKNNYSNPADTFIFGSISYQNQIRKLLELSNGDNSHFYIEAPIGFKLKNIYESMAYDIVFNKAIKATSNRFKNLVTDERLKHTTLMLNTPIVKSSIILSQLYAYEAENAAILTTQLNFNPLLISLTQYEDRLNLILANSIEETDPTLTEVMTLMDSDIRYNWVNYSTLVGINHLYSRNNDNLVKNQIIDSKVVYNTNLYYSTESSFKKINLEEYEQYEVLEEVKEEL